MKDDSKYVKTRRPRTGRVTPTGLSQEEHDRLMIEDFENHRDSYELIFVYGVPVYVRTKVK